MKIATLSIRRAVTFTMIYVFVIGFGLFGLSRLKIDLYPDVTFPVIAIITTYTGVAPADMENLVTKPIEEAVASVENIKHIRSQSKLGASLILAEFDWGIDIDKDCCLRSAEDAYPFHVCVRPYGTCRAQGAGQKTDQACP